MPEGIIIKGIGGFYEVMDRASDTREPECIYTCKARGVHRKESELTPLPGDRVVYRILDNKKLVGHVEKILERKNEFIRPPVANIDQLVAVVAVANPDPDLMLVDKLLITAACKAIRPLLIINKVDLDSEGKAEALKRVYEAAGVTVIVLSKFDKKSQEPLHKELADLNTAFAGQSGVGKSTLLNSVLHSLGPKDAVVMETGEVSEKIKRGKHTTRHVQLIRLKNGGFVLDTPGFSSYTVSDVAHDELYTYYGEMEELAEKCRFKGCSHTEEPGCAVKDKLLEGKIDRGRYERYVQLYKELKDAYDNRYRR